MEGLAKIAEGLVKPVLHVGLSTHEGEEHLFPVPDVSVRYERRVRALGGLTMKK